jgi:hypothetical protein
MIEILLHIERADLPGQPPEFVWWAESNEFPGFTAAAPTLAELRSVVRDAVRELDLSDSEIQERLSPLAVDVRTSTGVKVQQLMTV